MLVHTIKARQIINQVIGESDPRGIQHLQQKIPYIEQDHRRVKQRIRPMLGFNRFETATVTIRGIELAEKIKKQQFNLKPLTVLRSLSRTSKMLILRAGEVEAIKVHHLVPGRDEVVDELLLCV